MTNFWQKLDKPFTILAPMANVTDWAFRQIVIEAGASSEGVKRPDIFFSEFVSADGINAIGYERFKGELYFEENERPIVAQFFSSKPENIYRCAQLAQEWGFDGIDINMGCPDKSIEKQGAGAALMKNPKLAKEIITEAVRGAGPLPVSVKTRLGFNKIEPEWIDHLLDTEIAALSVHLRTRKEMSKVPARWEEAVKISEKAKKSGKVIIGNGDVMSMADARQKAEQYGLDGIMIGRGIFANPWLFAEREIADPKERIDLLKKHVENFEKLWGNPVKSLRDHGASKNFDVLKRFFKIYIQNWPGAKDLRTELMASKNKDQVFEILSKEAPYR